MANLQHEHPGLQAELEADYQKLEYLRALADLRARAGLSQREVAEGMGTHQPAIARLERGDSDPRLSTVLKYGAVIKARIPLPTGDGAIPAAQLLAEMRTLSSAHREHARLLDDIRREQSFLSEAVRRLEAIAPALLQGALSEERLGIERLQDRGGESDLVAIKMPSTVEDAAQAIFKQILHGPVAQNPLDNIFAASVRENAGDYRGATDAYARAIESGDRTAASLARWKLGILEFEHGNVDQAQRLWREVVDQGDTNVAPRAMNSLGVLYGRRGDHDKQIREFLSAINSGHSEAAPLAHCNLAIALRDEDPSEAKLHFQAAIASGHPKQGPKAARLLGLLLRDEGDLDGAKTALELAISAGPPEISARAANELGELLVARESGSTDLVEQAKRCFQLAIDTGDQEVVPVASINMAVVLWDAGSVEEAKATLQRAIDSHHPEYSPAASLKMAAWQEREGDLNAAFRSLQSAIDSGHEIFAREASLQLLLIAPRIGDQIGTDEAVRRARELALSDLPGQTPASERPTGDVAAAGEVELSPVTPLEHALSSAIGKPGLMESLREQIGRSDVLVLGHRSGDLSIPGYGTESDVLHFSVRVEGGEKVMLPIFTRPQVAALAVSKHPEWQTLELLLINGSALLQSVQPEVTIVVNPWTSLEFELSG